MKGGFYSDENLYPKTRSNYELVFHKNIQVKRVTGMSRIPRLFKEYFVNISELENQKD